MKKKFTFLLLAGVYLFCAGTGGTVSQSTLGEVALFSKKIGLPGFSGIVVYSKEEVSASDLCFYDPNDDDCTDGGEPVGVVYLNVNYDERPGRTVVWLKDIHTIEVLGEGLYAGRKDHFFRINVVYHPNKEGETKEDTFRVSTKIVLGGREEAGPSRRVGTVALQDVVAIKNIKMQPPSTEDLRRRIVGK